MCVCVSEKEAAPFEIDPRGHKVGLEVSPLFLIVGFPALNLEMSLISCWDHRFFYCYCISEFFHQFKQNKI